MSYHNWFHDWFRDKHHKAFSSNVNDRNMASTEIILDDVFGLLEFRGNEYLQNNEVYKDLYIDPKQDILNSKPQVIQQVREELREFLKLLLENRVRSVLQIGLGHYGSTNFALSLICDKVVTVEYDIKNIRNYTDREILYNQNKEFLIYGDSTLIKTFEQVKNFGPYDCIFVDGNHTYEYVKCDYEIYYPLLKTGGIFAFHDAKLETERYGTPKVLRELKDRHNIQIIDHSNEVGIAWFKKD